MLSSGVGGDFVSPDGRWMLRLGWWWWMKRSCRAEQQGYLYAFQLGHQPCLPVQWHGQSGPPANGQRVGKENRQVTTSDHPSQIDPPDKPVACANHKGRVTLVGERKIPRDMLDLGRIDNP